MTALSSLAYAADGAGGVSSFGVLLPLSLLGFIVYFLYWQLKKRKKRIARKNQQKLEEFSEYVSKKSESTKKTTDKKEEKIPDRDARKIFISYRREDGADVAGRIYDRLIAKFGKDHIFKDVDSIPLGADFRKYINNSISNSSVLLVVIGNRWLGQSSETGERRIDDIKDFPRLEVAAALKRKIPIIPVLVLSSKMPDEESLPEDISAFAYRNGIPVRPDPDFEHDIKRLIDGIEQIQQPDIS